MANVWQITTMVEAHMDSTIMSSATTSQRDAHANENYKHKVDQ